MTGTRTTDLADMFLPDAHDCDADVGLNVGQFSGGWAFLIFCPRSESCRVSQYALIMRPLGVNVNVSTFCYYQTRVESEAHRKKRFFIPSVCYF